MKSLSETLKTIDCREPGANNPRNKFPCSVGYKTQLSTALLTVFCWLQDTTIDCVSYRVLLVTGHNYRLRCLPCSVGYRTLLSTALLTVFCWLQDTTIDCVAYRISLCSGRNTRAVSISWTRCTCTPSKVKPNSGSQTTGPPAFLVRTVRRF